MDGRPDMPRADTLHSDTGPPDSLRTITMLTTAAPRFVPAMLAVDTSTNVLYWAEGRR